MLYSTSLTKVSSISFTTVSVLSSLSITSSDSTISIGLGSAANAKFFKIFFISNLPVVKSPNLSTESTTKKVSEYKYDGLSMPLSDESTKKTIANCITPADNTILKKFFFEILLNSIFLWKIVSKITGRNIAVNSNILLESAVNTISVNCNAFPAPTNIE